MNPNKNVNLIQEQDLMLRRMGRTFSAQDGDLVSEDSIFLNVVIGKAKDLRDFHENAI